MTDSLNMGAISIGMRLSPGQAAVRALTAGADVVLVNPGAGPGPVIDAVSAALARGSYPRASAIASARRVLAVKRTTNAPLPMTSLTPAQATRTPPSLRPCPASPAIASAARSRRASTYALQTRAPGTSPTAPRSP
jgi:beta-N-acetylhexosaminidase